MHEMNISQASSCTPCSIPVLCGSGDGERELVMARWGLIPFWMKEKPKVPHINAWAETVHCGMVAHETARWPN